MDAEEYVTIEELLPGQKCIINKKKYTADNNGYLFLSKSMLFVEKGLPMALFEEKISGLLNDLQKMNFYGICRISTNLILSSVTNALGGDRLLAKEILTLAESCKVLGRGYNCTWRIPKTTRERMVVLEDNLSNALSVTEKQLTGEEHRKLVLKSYEKSEVVEQEESSIDMSLSVNETLKQYKSTLTVPVKTSPAKTVKTPTKKPSLGKPLVVSRKPR